MTGIYTREELIQKIKDVDASIEAATKAKSYSINSGMSSQSVTAQDVPQLIKVRAYWMSLLDELDGISVIMPMRGR